MTTLLLITGVLALWALLTSATFVKTGQVGLVYLFRSEFYRVLKPGLRFVLPFGVDRVETYSIQSHQEELPAEPEQIDRVNSNAESGKKLPFRVPQKGMHEAQFYVLRAPNLDPLALASYDVKSFQELTGNNPSLKTAMEEESLHAPLTSEIAAVVEWNLVEDFVSLHDFIANVSPSGGRDREAEVKKRIEDMVLSTLQDLLGSTTCGHALERIALFSRTVREKLEILVGEVPPPTGETPKPWGIHLSRAYIKSIHPGHQVNDARAKAAAAVSKRRETILDAEADKQAQILRNDAAADQVTRVVLPVAQSELTVRARAVLAYENNTTVTTFAPGSDSTIAI